MKRTTVIAAVLLGSHGVAIAQPGQTPTAPVSPATDGAGAPAPAIAPSPVTSPPPVMAPPPVEERSPGVGVALAVGGTILPAIGFGVGVNLSDTDTGVRVAMVSLVAGLVLPGAGMYYGGHKRTIGQYPRSAAFITLVLGLLIDGLGDSRQADSYYAVAAGLYVVGSGIDIVMTPGAVRGYNARKARPLALAPMVVTGGGGVVIGGAL